MSETETETNGMGLSDGHTATPGYVGMVLAIVFVWGFGDVMSTFLALAYTGDAGIEANPWIRALVLYDPLLVLALKGAVVLLVGVVLLECRETVEHAPGWRLWFLGLIGTGTVVVLNNVAVALGAVA
jgi:hypothetical protein